MPLISSTYVPPRWLSNGHALTVYPYFFRQIEDVHYDRERIDTPDGDFLDLDWSLVNGHRLVVLLHGLEGNASRPYMRGMARAFNRRGWDALAMNMRGCSGILNRLSRSYHGGASDDLVTVLRHVAALDRYERIALVSFSLGANIALKYLAESAAQVPIASAVAFSVPTDFPAGDRHLNRWTNWPYRTNFVRSMQAKAVEKHRRGLSRMPEPPDRYPRSLREFDAWYTAPVHGFQDVDDYYDQVSSKRFIPQIPVPTLLVNALDDPLLPSTHYPFEAASSSRSVFLETPDAGGHVGFVSFGSDGEYWSEQRAVEFVMETAPPRAPSILR